MTFFRDGSSSSAMRSRGLEALASSSSVAALLLLFLLTAGDEDDDEDDDDVAMLSFESVLIVSSLRVATVVLVAVLDALIVSVEAEAVIDPAALPLFFGCLVSMPAAAFVDAFSEARGGVGRTSSRSLASVSSSWCDQRRDDVSRHRLR